MLISQTQYSKFSMNKSMPQTNSMRIQPPIETKPLPLPLNSSEFQLTHIQP